MYVCVHVRVRVSHYSSRMEVPWEQGSYLSLTFVLTYVSLDACMHHGSEVILFTEGTKSRQIKWPTNNRNTASDDPG